SLCARASGRLAGAVRLPESILHARVFRFLDEYEFLPDRSEYDAMARDSGMGHRKGPRTEGTHAQLAAAFESRKSDTQYFKWTQVFDGAHTCGSKVPSRALLRKGSIGQAQRQSRRTLSRSEFRLEPGGSERD